MSAVPCSGVCETVTLVWPLLTSAVEPEKPAMHILGSVQKKVVLVDDMVATAGFDRGN